MCVLYYAFPVAGFVPTTAKMDYTKLPLFRGKKKESRAALRSVAFVLLTDI
jgi:hypothetical protein